MLTDIMTIHRIINDYNLSLGGLNVILIYTKVDCKLDYHQSYWDFPTTLITILKNLDPLNIRVFIIYLFHLR